MAHDAAEIAFAVFAVQVADFVATIQQPTGSRNHSHRQNAVPIPSICKRAWDQIVVVPVPTAGDTVALATDHPAAGKSERLVALPPVHELHGGNRCAGRALPTFSDTHVVM